MSIAENAKKIAYEAHKGQMRKWSNVPYIVHPERVALKVATLSGMTEDDIAAAWLHDLCEDVAIPQNKLAHYEELIQKECGDIVLSLVRELTWETEGPEWQHRSRAEKNVIRFKHLGEMSKRAQRIKLVDRWDNCLDMKGAPRKLRAKYAPESRQLGKLIGHADEQMAKELNDAVDALEKSLSQ